jgi:hypothetical protein
LQLAGSVVFPWALFHELAEVGKRDELWQRGEEVGSWSVRHRVEAHLDQLLLQVGVPEILDFIVGSPGEVLRDG